MKDRHAHIPQPAPPRAADAHAYGNAGSENRPAYSQDEEFLLNISHEFKTPLVYIQSYATLLQDDSLSDEERSECLDGIIAGTRRLSNMVSSLLELTMASRSDDPLEMTRFSLDEQLRHAVALFVPIMESKNISYVVELEDVCIAGNENLLDEVWANLLSNAVKYTPSDGTIAVRLATVEGNARVTVSDTGIGIGEDRLEKVFDRFYRDRAATNYEGVGLGLSIAKAIVDKHHGTIELDSSPGNGTTCTVTLPARQ